MKLEIFVIDGHPFNIRPAPAERRWMDETSDKYAYRCLPLNIANCFGWEILCAADFSATWNGSPGLSDIWIYPEETNIVCSHFGSGILTFHIPCLFKTDPGIALMVRGPINTPKDGIEALTGIVETEWSPYTFTMNWIFTHPGRVEFKKDEPFCHVFPVSCDMLESVEPELKLLSDNPGLEKEHKIWTESRSKFIKDLVLSEPDAKAKGWQKTYFRGDMPSGCPAPVQKHRTKLRLKDFKDNPLKNKTKLVLDNAEPL